MTGPRPMPTRIKMLTGNRGKRPLGDREPEPKVRIPDKPAVLYGAAAEEWDRITELLYDLGLVTEIDRAALAAYCQCYGRWVQAEEQLKAEGLIIKTSTGYPIQSLYLSIANKALEQMKKFLVEFGMTPSSRTRVTTVGNKNKKTSFADI